MSRLTKNKIKILMKYLNIRVLLTILKENVIKRNAIIFIFKIFISILNLT